MEAVPEAIHNVLNWLDLLAYALNQHRATSEYRSPVRFPVGSPVRVTGRQSGLTATEQETRTVTRKAKFDLQTAKKLAGQWNNGTLTYLNWQLWQATLLHAYWDGSLQRRLEEVTRHPMCRTPSVLDEPEIQPVLPWPPGIAPVGRKEHDDKDLGDEPSVPKLSQSWLLDPRLDAARVKLALVLHQMRQCEEWSDEMDALWHKIQVVESAQAAMSDAIGLTKERRNAAAAASELDYQWQKLSDELELCLKHLQKVGGHILDEYLQQSEDSTIPQ